MLKWKCEEIFAVQKIHSYLDSPAMIVLWWQVLSFGDRKTTTGMTWNVQPVFHTFSTSYSPNVGEAASITTRLSFWPTVLHCYPTRSGRHWELNPKGKPLPRPGTADCIIQNHLCGIEATGCYDNILPWCGAYTLSTTKSRNLHWCNSVLVINVVM